MCNLAIVTVCQTSKGIFADEHDAIKKTNRTKIVDIYSPDYGCREIPKMILALKSDMGYFKLEQLEVK